MKRTDIKAGDRITVAAVVESEGHDDQHVIARIAGQPVQVPIPDSDAISLPVPPRVYAKLKEIAGSSSVENWARRALIDAAEEASPSLRDSGMWSMDTGEWYSLVNPSDDEDLPMTPTPGEATFWRMEAERNAEPPDRWTSLREQITRDAAIEQELGDDYGDKGTDEGMDSASRHWERAKALREVLATMDRMEEQ